MNKRAAHFLLQPVLWNSPPNDALVRAYTSCGYDVDMYSPEIKQEHAAAKLLPVEYGFKWIFKNAFSLRWRHYDAFSCTTEDPVAVAGVLAFIWRKPLIVLSDEIRAGSYWGNRPFRFKKLCLWALKKAKLTIVNDQARIALQQEYASLNKKAEIMVYPGCFVEPPKPIDKDEFRINNDIKSDQIVLSFSGYLSIENGIDWALEGLEKLPNAVLSIQPLALKNLASYLLPHHKLNSQIRIAERRLSWQESWSSMGGVDIGISLYKNQAPQFQNMGISSNRLCMFLAMGVPVIVDRQPSFKFIEEYDCGVMVDGPEEFAAAVEHIHSRLPVMKENALKCTKEYIDTQGRLEQLKSAVAIALRA